jgi:hypothetical protein
MGAADNKPTIWDFREVNIFTLLEYEKQHLGTSNRTA